MHVHLSVYLKEVSKEVCVNFYFCSFFEVCSNLKLIWDALHDLVHLYKLKKCKKHL